MYECTAPCMRTYVNDIQGKKKEEENKEKGFEKYSGYARELLKTGHSKFNAPVFFSLGRGTYTA